MLLLVGTAGRERDSRSNWRKRKSGVLILMEVPTDFFTIWSVVVGNRETQVKEELLVKTVYLARG